MSALNVPGICSAPFRRVASRVIAISFFAPATYVAFDAVTAATIPSTSDGCCGSTDVGR
ncbi:hypothetical protein [Nonomuraea sp. NPDC049504]|uniref:hypothetical protein n=1 Tax=Nonomuraea sp. NPDC049504 TaxID=3154729 RepID=UPI00342807B0